MNAVLDKPRAKAKPKAPVRTAQSATAELITALKRGVDKIGMAYDNAEPGEPAGVLLEHVIDILAEAIRPIWNEPLTRADTDAAYNAMFVPLAALKGAIALSKDTVIEHVLVEAHATLDAAQTSIDSCAGLSNLLPDGAAREEADFLRGRDMAVAMLREGNSFWNEADAEPRRSYRMGAAQNRFARKHLEQALADPACLEGFSAVLSARLGVGDALEADYFAVPRAEYEAGVVGADGTQGDDDPAETPATDNQASTPEAAFMHGKALLALLLRTSDDHSEGDQSSLISNYREDTDSVYVPQTNFAEPILRQLIARPDLLDGFSGALSHALASVSFEGSWNDIASATYKACRMLNPYCEAVDVNYDGPSLDAQLFDLGVETSPSPSRTAAAPRPHAAPIAVPIHSERDDEDFDPYCLMLQARDVAEAAFHEDGSDAIWGLHSLIEKTVGKVSAVVEAENATDEDVRNDASTDLAGTLAVVNAVNNDTLDNSLLYGVASLIRMAKWQIDTEIDRLARARPERGAA